MIRRVKESVMKERVNYNDLSAFDYNLSHSKTRPFRTLVSMYKGNYRRMGFAIILFLIKNSPAWVIPIVTANIINIATYPGDHTMREFWLNMLVAILVISQNVPVTVWQTKVYSIAVRYVEAALRSSLVRKLQQLSIGYHKELQSGKLQSKVIRDIEAIDFVSHQFFYTLLPVTTNILVALIVTMTKSFTVMLFYLIALPISIFLIIAFKEKMTSTNTEFRKEIEDMSAKMSDMIEMISTTRAHGLEEVEVEKLDYHFNRVQSRGYELDVTMSLFGASNWVVFQLFQLLCLAFTCYLAYNQRITIGEVVLYQGYFNAILNQISHLISIYPNMIKGFESVNSVSEILMVHDVENYNGKKFVKEVKGDIRFEEVSFSYASGEKPVISELTLHIREGESIAFVGESGAGKSTILNLLIGFFQPSKGEIYLDGDPMSKLNIKAFRKNIAIVPQDTVLFSGSIRDNITYGMPSVEEKSLLEAVDAANLKGLIEDLPQGLDTMVGEHGGKLSGGQKQRIIIARALIRDPRVIILDEATSALDNHSEQLIQKSMENLIKGRTTLMVAHRLSTIRKADRIIVLDNGRIVESGSYNELMASEGAFYRLENRQAEMKG